MDSSNHHGSLEDPPETMETQMRNSPRPQKSENVGKTCALTSNEKSVLTEGNHVQKRTMHVQHSGTLMENENSQCHQVLDPQTQTPHTNGCAGS